jgi:endonuclease G
MPNTTGIMANDWGGYRTTVDAIERRSGYDFLTRVPAAVQSVIEARIDTGPTTAK